ncbi:MAG: FG-GAP-like repeat-containing protein, partial [Candidatus Methylomirabilis sp.]
MARRSRRKPGTHWRPGSSSLLLGGFTFFLILAGIFSITLANHSTTTWDFGTASEYTYDPNKIAVESGVAHLRKSFTVTHSTQADFDGSGGNTGTYSGTAYNTSAPAPGVKLSAPPTAGTYTSPAIDAGVATTTWKTLSQLSDLQQAAPPATFGARTSVGTQTAVNEINAADFNRDGAVDVVATNVSGGTRRIWIYQSSAANPPTFTQIPVTESSTSPCTGVDNGLSSVATARYGIEDMDNDLNPDLVEPGQQTINTNPLFLYVNPLAAPGGTPQCWTKWLTNGRLLEDIRLANINGDTYTSTDPFKNGRPILDIVAVESRIGTGSAASPSGGVFWFRNDGTVSPDAPVFGTRSVDAYTLGSATVEGPTTVVAGDINNDGLLDIVAGWPTAYNGPLAKANTSPQIRGYISGGGDPPTWTAFTLVNLAACGAPPCPNGSNDIWLVDMDGDGFLDVVHAANTAGTITWYKNPCTSTPCTPTGTWTAFTIDAAATGVTSLAVADLDLDGDRDIVANSSSATAGVVWYENPSWTKRTLTTTAGGTGVVVANLNSNGDLAPDIIASGTSGAGTIDRWLNTLSHSNIRFQVRTWSQGDNTCSTPTGSFIGSDGTTGTYYTGTSETLRVTNNQCFQYKASFFSNDATKNPNVRSVTINYERTFATDSPSIQPNTGVAYSRLTDFTETLGPGHAGGVGSAVQYQLCKLGDTCYYWNGSLWVSASGAAQSNDAATVKAQIGFFDDYAGHAPGTQSSTFYFKAFLVSDGNKQVELDAGAVQPDLISATLNRPIGGETWEINQTQDLTWSYSCQGSPCGNLKLEYSTDGGSAWSLVSDTVINGANGGCTVPGGSTGCYTWTIPASAASSTAKVRVSDKDTPVVKSASANFTITGTARVISPNGGETFTVNGSTTFTWSVSGAANVKLEYSKKGDFTDAVTIVAAAANGANGGCTVPGGATGCYPWTIPDAIATTVKVRVTDTANAALTDPSDNPFTITGTMTLTAPNGGEIFTVGNPITINWSTLGNIPTVKLEYSTNGGSTWTLITASTTSTPATPPTLGSGSYAWTAPTDTSAQFRVRVSDADTLNRPPTSDLSDANFTVKGTIAVNSPTPGMVAGESYTVGNSATIAWATTGTIATIKVEYSTNGFLDETQTTQVTASAANGSNGGCTVPGGSTGCYPWTMPDAASSTVKVRVSDARPEFSATVRSSSPNNFTLKGGLTVSSPVGTDVWKVGEVKTLSWTSTGAGAIPTVDLQYSKNGLFTDTVTIATAVASGPTGGNYSWTVADAIATTVKIRVKHPTDATVSADSAAFTIKGSLTLTAPVGGEAWAVGSSRTITWTRTGSIANVKLEYSKDDFATPVLITASTPAAAGSYAWTIPDDISSTVKVRITNLDDATVNSTSPANFSIKGSVTVTAPNGGESWTIGSTQTITWTKTGTIGNVRLDYSTDGGLTYPNVITLSTPAASLSYSWTVPDTPTGQARVKITLVSDTSVNDASDGNFGMKGTVTLTAPNGGETWIVGESRTITWTKTGAIANVKLEYSTDGGATYPNLITASTPAASLSYSWTVPDVIGTALRVRVTDAGDATVSDDSNANFTIKGSLTLTAPIGGEAWTVGSTQTVTWTKTGTLADVKLEYSMDGGTTYPNVITASTPAVSGSFAWTIPDAISATVKVRITLNSDTTVTHSSPGNFKIRGSLTVTAPNGCTATDFAIVTMDANLPIVSIAPPSLLTCAVTSVVLNVNGAGQYVYNWIGPNGFSSNQSSPVITFPGSYTLIVTNTANGCSSTATIVVSQDIAPPIADAGPDTGIPCGGTQTTLSANSGPGP